MVPKWFSNKIIIAAGVLSHEIWLGDVITRVIASMTCTCSCCRLIKTSTCSCCLFSCKKITQDHYSFYDTCSCCRLL